MMKNKRIIGILVSLSLMLSASVLTFATTENISNTGKGSAGKALAYIQPDFTVQLRDSIKIFKNANGERIYPIVYNGSTYLPVRAISALMGEEIEWDNYSRTVFIGKTLSNPNKSKVKKEQGETASSAAVSISKENYVVSKEKKSTITVDIRSDIKIMYDFEIQDFADATGLETYPLLYEGSTYLPVRAISKLMGEEIEWDNVTKTVKIGKEGEEPEEVEVTPVTKRLVAEFEDAVETYDQATAKITGIQKSTDSAVLYMLANSVSEDVREAEKQTAAMKKMRLDLMTDEEIVAHQALCDFLELSQNYLLVLENIAYLAAEETDYSMLAETFLSFALESQTKMNKARNLIEALPQ